MVIIAHLVAPNAKAPSRSPIGVCINASRIIEVWVGTTIKLTTIPAIKADEVNALGSINVSPASFVTEKMGIQPKLLEIHFETGMMFS